MNTSTPSPLSLRTLSRVSVLKTGESGLTVFRLLSKPGSWVWVKSNAKIIYKGGRPEFIIAYQKAIR